MSFLGRRTGKSIRLIDRLPLFVVFCSELERELFTILDVMREASPENEGEGELIVVAEKEFGNVFIRDPLRGSGDSRLLFKRIDANFFGASGWNLENPREGPSLECSEIIEHFRQGFGIEKLQLDLGNRFGLRDFEAEGGRPFAPLRVTAAAVAGARGWPSLAPASRGALCRRGDRV